MMIKYFSSICFTLFFIQSAFVQNSIVISGETLSHHNKNITKGIMLELKLLEANDQFFKIFEAADSVNKDSIYDDNNNLIRYIESTLNSNGERIEICINYSASGLLQSVEHRVNDTIIYMKTHDENKRVSEVFYTIENEDVSFRHTYEYNTSGIVTLEKIYDSSQRLVGAIEYTGEQVNKVVFKNYYYYNSDFLSYVIVEDFYDNLHKVLRHFYSDGKLDYTVVYNKKGKEIERIPGS